MHARVRQTEVVQHHEQDGETSQSVQSGVMGPRYIGDDSRAWAYAHAGGRARPRHGIADTADQVPHRLHPFAYSGGSDRTVARRSNVSPKTLNEV